MSEGILWCEKCHKLTSREEADQRKFDQWKCVCGGILITEEARDERRRKAREERRRKVEPHCPCCGQEIHEGGLR